MSRLAKVNRLVALTSSESLTPDDVREVGALCAELREWDEEEHPRDEHGKFADGDGVNDKSRENLNELLYSWQETSNFEGEKAETAIRTGKPESNALVMAIRNETFDRKIYRGMYLWASYQPNSPVNPNRPLDWKVGDEVQIMPSSFSTDRSVAAQFATGEKQGIANKPGYRQVVLEVAPIDSNAGPAHGVIVGERGNPDYKDDDEVITGGRFRVADVKSGAHKTRISLYQLGVF